MGMFSLELRSSGLEDKCNPEDGGGDSSLFSDKTLSPQQKVRVRMREE